MKQAPPQTSITVEATGDELSICIPPRDTGFHLRFLFAYAPALVALAVLQWLFDPRLRVVELLVPLVVLWVGLRWALFAWKRPVERISLDSKRLAVRRGSEEPVNVVPAEYIRGFERKAHKRLDVRKKHGPLFEDYVSWRFGRPFLFVLTGGGELPIALEAEGEDLPWLEELLRGHLVRLRHSAQQGNP